ncbi:MULTISPECIES: Dam family site-specific DNA-(adenine-N6)-methyltransferase [unclassified Mesorhizobium]|uniref:DNA adenine methylase n=1 Tax=unclassified Mesorhizobium TaxID=325217 RepID=UPI003337A5F5
MSWTFQTDEIVVPFLKWAGGKRWFCENHLHFVPEFKGRYIEPFLGSAAVFFALRPQKAFLSDLNLDLITTYSAIRDAPLEVGRLLRYHHARHSDSHYYATRAVKPKPSIELAAWFIYLNRTCWNGLYRVNLRNQFNVPIGTKTDVIMQTDDFEKTSVSLQSATLSVTDFESTIDMAEADDFVFVDPPYTVKHNYNGFIKYNDKIFSWADQIRLRDAVVRAAGRGASIMVLNANHESVRDLYSGVGEQTTLARASVIAASAASRSSVEELMICAGGR